MIYLDEINPNDLNSNAKTNCIGYSALFNSLANHIFENQNLNDRFRSRHFVAKIYLFGIDIHQYFNSDFFRDHDINEITDTRTGDKFYTDPTLYDYLKIDRITVID